MDEISKQSFVHFTYISFSLAHVRKKMKRGGGGSKQNKIKSKKNHHLTPLQQTKQIKQQQKLSLNTTAANKTN